MFHPLQITNLRRETEDCVSLAFAVPPEHRDTFAFTPGQYLTLRTTIDGAEIRRSYSICTAPADGELRVAIKHIPDGRFSHYANTALAPGDTLDVMPPEGRFGAPIGPGTYLGIAAGSGITPILSLLKAVLAAPDTNFVLLYGSRSVSHILFRTELEDLKDRYLGRLTLIHVLSREEQDIPILSGRLDAEKVAALLPPAVNPADIAHAFICGPGAMLDSLTTCLTALQVISQCLQAATGRDCLSGWGGVVHVITKEGVMTRTLRGRMD